MKVSELEGGKSNWNDPISISTFFTLDVFNFCYDDASDIILLTEGSPSSEEINTAYG